MIALVAFVLAWIGCGVLGYGYTIGYLHGKFPTVPLDESDIGFARYIGIMGPIGLLVAWMMSSFKYGWMWSVEEKEKS